MASNIKKGAAEARAAMSELFAELDRTRKEFAKASLQLTHLETTVQHQRDSESRKDQAIAHLESELKRREDSYRSDLQVLQEEARAKEAAWEHKTKFLDMEVSRLSQEVSAANNFEKDNRQLRDSLLEAQATVEKLQMVIEELKLRAREDAREHAAQLEAEFKRRLAESEKKFRAEAYRALSDEAKVALQGNDHLQAVLQRQNDAIESILLKCKQLEQSHATLVGEQETSAQSLQHHVAEIQRLKRQLSDASHRNTQLEDALQQRKVERASLELLFVEFEATRKQLVKAQEQSRRATRESERWRQRAVQLTQELGAEERGAAEHQLEQIASQGEALEAHLQRSRARAERRDRDRERNAAGAQAYRTAAGTGGGGDDDRWSVLDPGELDRDAADGPEDAATAAGARLLNPTDVLRMWNARFQGDDDPHGLGGVAPLQLTASTPGGLGEAPPPLPATSSPPAQLGEPSSSADNGNPAGPPMLADAPLSGRGLNASGEESGAVGGPRPPAYRSPAAALAASAPVSAPLQRISDRPFGVVSSGAGVAMMKTDDLVERRNKEMSVLAQGGKQHTLPAPARHLVKGGAHGIGGGNATSSMMPLPTLGVVTKGEFETIRVRGGAPAVNRRYIAP